MVKRNHEKCFFCKATMAQKKVTVDYWWKNELIIIEKVPAWVCTQCGEEVYEGVVAEKMEQVAKAKAKKKTLLVDVKSFDEATAMA